MWFMRILPKPMMRFLWGIMFLSLWKKNAGNIYIRVSAFDMISSHCAETKQQILNLCKRNTVDNVE